MEIEDKKCCGCPDDCIKYDDNVCPRFSWTAPVETPRTWEERNRPNGSFAFRFD